MVAVSTDNDCAVKDVIHSILQQREGEMHIGLFFLVPLPRRPADLASSRLFAKSSHVTLDAGMFQSGHVLAMASILGWQPSRVGWEIRNFYEVFSVTAQRFRERPKVEPLQVRSIEIGYGVVEVKTIYITGDSAHYRPR
jgi:hypothetical protein